MESNDLTAMQQRAEDASRLLKALANAQRLRVVCLLVGREMTVGQINEELPDLSQSALSQHLARLRKDRLVNTRRDAQTIYYSMHDQASKAIVHTLHEIYCPE